MGTPSDNGVTTASIAANAVTGAKLNTDVISAQTALGATPADTDEFLVSDAGVLKRVDYSYIKGGGITEADMFRLTADLSSNANPISSNLERVDDATFSKMGTGMSLSSGIFTFPSTGLYEVSFNVYTYESSADSHNVWIYVSSDSGSNYDAVAVASSYASGREHMSKNAFVNVTNASNFRVKFATSSFTSVTLLGDTDTSITSFTFIRLGDSQ